MRKILAGLGLAFAASVVLAPAASADPIERECYTPHVKGFDTFEVCYWIPVIE